MPKAHAYVSLGDCEITRTTDLAVLMDGENWIPRSVILNGADLEEGDNGEVLVKKWFADKEDLTYYGDVQYHSEEA